MERQLSGPAAAWLRDCGYTVYAEIPLTSSSMDLVGRNGSALRVVELKMTWSKKLLLQCILDQLVTPDVYAVSPTQPLSATVQRFQEAGIGMLRVATRVEVLLRTTCVKEGFAYYVDKVHKYLDRTVPSDEGGLPCLEGVGPAVACEMAIRNYRAQHPKATWKDIFHVVPNHYATPKSMAGAMLLLKRRRAEKAR